MRPSVLVLETEVSESSGAFGENYAQIEQAENLRPLEAILVREYFLPRGSGETCFLLPVTIRGYAAAVVLTYYDPAWKRGAKSPLRYKAFIVVPGLELVAEVPLSEKAKAFCKIVATYGSNPPNMSSFSYDRDEMFGSRVSSVPNSMAMFHQSSLGVLFLSLTTAD